MIVDSELAARSFRGHRAPARRRCAVRHFALRGGSSRTPCTRRASPTMAVAMSPSRSRPARRFRTTWRSWRRAVNVRIRTPRPWSSYSRTRPRRGRCARQDLPPQDEEAPPRGREPSRAEGHQGIRRRRGVRWASFRGSHRHHTSIAECTRWPRRWSERCLGNEAGVAEGMPKLDLSTIPARTCVTGYLEP